MYYHLYNRGNNRQSIFFQPENYLYFLGRVKKYIVPLAKVVAYCLMSTHYHMLLHIEKASEFLENLEVYSARVSNAIKRLSVSYTKAINKRFERVGSLFQGQFQAKPIQTYSHLRNLCIYIHANPAKDGLVALPEDWVYSNYLEWLGQRDGTLVDREFIQEHFGSPVKYHELGIQFVKTCYLSDDMRKYLESFED